MCNVLLWISSLKFANETIGGKNGTWSVNDSSPISPISTPSPCHTQSPSWQGI